MALFTLLLLCCNSECLPKMSFTSFQKAFHYPLGQDDPSGKANEMISEFPGSFCPTTYHSISREPLKETDAGNVFHIKCSQGDYLTDLYLTIEIPREIGFSSKAQAFVQKNIDSVELQWKDDRVSIQTLRSRFFDENFRWRYRTITETIYRPSAEADKSDEQIVVVVKLPWFFSKEMKSGIPLLYVKGLDAIKQPLQVKINFSQHYLENLSKAKFGFIAEYAQVTDEERNYFLGIGGSPQNPNRNKRVVYEEASLDQLKPQSIVTRMSWKDSDTIIEITNDSTTKTLDSSRSPELHWDFFGNEWAVDYKRFSYSFGAPPGRAVSTILSGVPFSRIKLASLGREEDLCFVVQKLAIFSQNNIRIEGV